MSYTIYDRFHLLQQYLYFYTKNYKEHKESIPLWHKAYGHVVSAIFSSRATQQILIYLIGWNN